MLVGRTEVDNVLHWRLGSSQHVAWYTADVLSFPVDVRNGTGAVKASAAVRERASSLCHESGSYESE